MYARIENSWKYRPVASRFAQGVSARLIGVGADNALGKIAGPFGRACVAGSAERGAFVSPNN